VIEAIGEAVTHFQVGDEVYYSPQVLASLVVMLNTTLQRKALLQLSINLTHVGQRLPLAGAAWDCLITRGNLQVGETVLIHAGAGGVGSIAIQLAKAMGAYIFTTCSAENFDFVKKLGAELSINYKHENYIK